MKVILAKSAGFCSGVKRAITIALETSKTQKPVYMLGDIVHNEDVVRSIKHAGIKKIAALAPVKQGILLIRAHGTARATFDKATALGYEIVDATCPMVKEIQKIAQRMEREGYRIIIIGDKKHDEVRGIMGQLQRPAIVIDKIEAIPERKLSTVQKAAIVLQSTQNIDRVEKIVARIKPFIKDVQFFNTICRPTRLKQSEIKILPSRVNAMIVIGSKTSANTKRLYEISKAINSRTYWVSAKDQIKKEWFKGARSVGVTAGASTPESSIHSIVEYLQSL